MEKLKKYNQKLLAIIGTLVLAVLVVYIIIGGIFLGSELIDHFTDRDYQDNAITLSDTLTTDEGREVIKRDQALSFSQPRLIDTLNFLYIIPVSQVNLKGVEDVLVEKEVYGLLNAVSKGGRKYYRFDGYFNNVIVYDQKSDQKYPLFKSKVVVTEFEAHRIDGKYYLILEGAIDDSNNDNKLDRDDLKSLFVYDFESNKLSKFGFENMGLEWYYLTYETSEILISYTIDKDQNGEVDKYQEPTIIKKLDLSTGEIDNLIDQNLIDHLQQLID